MSRALRLNKPWAVLVVLCLGLFMTLLDITIVNIAIPSLSKGLHAPLDQVLWVINAYSLVYAVLLITAGWATTSAPATCSPPPWPFARGPARVEATPA